MAVAFVWSIQSLRILGAFGTRRLWVDEIVRLTGVSEKMTRKIVVRLRARGFIDSAMETSEDLQNRSGRNLRRFYWLSDHGRKTAADISEAIASSAPRPVLERVIPRNA